MVNNGRVGRLILHTSDLQVRSLNDQGCRDLELIVNLALETNVDLVIIAGDLFDHDRIRDNTVSFVAEQLRRSSVSTVILPGNHDCLVPNSAYNRLEKANHSSRP